MTNPLNAQPDPAPPDPLMLSRHRAQSIADRLRPAYAALDSAWMAAQAAGSAVRVLADVQLANAECDRAERLAREALAKLREVME